MRHDEFRIGLEFWCGGRRWRCTDLGSRVVVAICLEPHHVETVVSSPETASTRTTRTVADDESWLEGPPYAVPEEVFDEHSIEDCRLTADEDGESHYGHDV
jgi:hypothetical protein